MVKQTNTWISVAAVQTFRCHDEHILASHTHVFLGHRLVFPATSSCARAFPTVLAGRDQYPRLSAVFFGKTEGSDLRKMAWTLKRANREIRLSWGHQSDNSD
ncbi:hypothetical protein AMECASPLE_022631 [Ameca splendens]|uniref:Uncharacterized protein n=1 Tax=Ameca splendens TaxID=208324 RepID=A0ABV0ZDG1_9TELE